MNVLVVNGAACGNDAAYNAIRLASVLAWVYPLPPDGPLTLVASWLEHGVPREPPDLDGATPGALQNIRVCPFPPRIQAA